MITCPDRLWFVNVAAVVMTLTRACGLWLRRAERREELSILEAVWYSYIPPGGLITPALELCHFPCVSQHPSVGASYRSGAQSRHLLVQKKKKKKTKMLPWWDSSLHRGGWGGVWSGLEPDVHDKSSTFICISSIFRQRNDMIGHSVVTWFQASEF